MKKEIYLQTQNLKNPAISKVKPVGWCAINFDNIRLIVDAYQGTPCQSEPRENSIIKIVDDNTIFELDAEQLLSSIKFFQQYNQFGNDLLSYRNKTQAVMPDRYLNALKVSKKGLEF
jgi:hypothetical protein